MKRKRVLIAVKVPEEIQNLRQALISGGYEVKLVENGVSALTLCREFQPHIMLSEIDLPKIDGHHLIREIKSQSATKNIPFVLMSRHRSVEERVHSMNLDIDDYVTTPFEANEVVLRIEIILKEIEKFESSLKKYSKGFSGKLAEINLVELLQTLEISKKSGIIKIQSDNNEGIVFVKDGLIVDATVGNLKPRKALFRMFSWSDGTFQVDIREIAQVKVITESTEELIYEGLILRDRWEKLTRNLPPLQATVKIAPKLFDTSLTVDEKTLLNLVTKNIRLIDLIEDSKFDDLKSLYIITRLFNRGAILEVQPEEGAGKSDLSLKKRNLTSAKNDRQLSNLIVNFMDYKAQLTNKSKIDRRRGERRQIERRIRSRRWSDFDIENTQIYLNKSELLMIREKLANGSNGKDALAKSL